MAKIPEIPEADQAPLGALTWLKNWLDMARLWIQTRDPTSQAGDPIDKFTARSELIDLGLISRNTDGSFTAAIGGIVGPPGPAGATGPPGAGVPTPDLTPPPTPTGLAVSAAISHIFIEWDAPTYTVGHGHAQTNIYGAIWVDPDAEPFFADVRTKLIDNVLGSGIIAAYATNPATRWCIWIKWQTIDGVESVSPAGDPARPGRGFVVTTGQDVAALLTVLAGEITSSELATSLNTRINLIDDADSVVGSVAARVKTERDRAIAAEGLIVTDVTALELTVNDGATGVAATASALDTVELIVNHASTGNVALGSRSSALEATVNDGTTGVAATASALDVVELVVSHASTGNTALGARTNSLEATVNNVTTGVAATASALDTVELLVNSGTEGNVALASRASALEATVNDVTTGVVATAAALDVVSLQVSDGTYGLSATASRTTTLESQMAGATGSALKSSIEAEALTRAGETGDLFSQYTVKIDLNGYMSGYGLMSSLTSGGTPTSLFIVSVDKFAVATPSSSVSDWSHTTATDLNAVRGISGVTDKLFVCKKAGTTGGSAPSIAGAIGTTVADNDVIWQIASRVPFSVLTTPTTINGATIPAGVYIDAAYVLNGTLQNAQIANLAVDDAKIADLAVAKLLAGNLRVGGYIRSTAYSAGVSGWTINADGSVEFNNGTFRGALAAATGTFAGSLTAATGSFTGSLSGASITGTTGTFSGSLSVKSALTGARTEILTSGVYVYHADGTTLAVQISA